MPREFKEFSMEDCLEAIKQAEAAMCNPKKEGGERLSLSRDRYRAWNDTHEPDTHPSPRIVARILNAAVDPEDAPINTSWSDALKSLGMSTKRPRGQDGTPRAQPTHTRGRGFRFRDEPWDAVVKVADANGVTIAEVCRFALEKFLYDHAPRDTVWNPGVDTQPGEYGNSIEDNPLREIFG